MREQIAASARTTPHPSPRRRMTVGTRIRIWLKKLTGRG